MHNIKATNEALFAGTLSCSFTWYVNKNGSSPLCQIFAFISKNIMRKTC